jgi:putative acetyltransferase
VPAEVAIRAVRTAEELEVARALFSEYGDMPHVEGRWPNRHADLAALPGPYAPPTGTILIAWRGDEPLGCVGLSELEPGRSCEMKRLFVREIARGSGAGRRLVEALLDEARAMGYALMRLDTAPELMAARNLYTSLGFRSIPPYHDRYADIVCYEKEL